MFNTFTVLAGGEVCMNTKLNCFAKKTKKNRKGQSIYTKAHNCGANYRIFQKMLEDRYFIMKEDPVFVQTLRTSITRFRKPLLLVENDVERLIIEHEILGGKQGKWYREYFSESTYRRYLTRACKDFIFFIELN